MIKSCPVLVQRILGPKDIGRNEYFFAGYDIIDGKECSQGFYSNDMVILAEVKYDEKRVVCTHLQIHTRPTLLTSSMIERGICGNSGHNVYGWDESSCSESRYCTGHMVYVVISQDGKDYE